MDNFEQDVVERLARIEVHLENFTEHNRDIEERVRAIETKQRYLTGASAVLTMVLGFLGYHVTLH